MSANYPIYSMYVTLYTIVPTISILPNTEYVCMYVTQYTAVTTVSFLPNIQYVCYAIYRSNNCQPLTQYTVCMLR